MKIIELATPTPSAPEQIMPGSLVIRTSGLPHPSIVFRDRHPSGGSFYDLVTIVDLASGTSNFSMQLAPGEAVHSVVRNSGWALPPKGTKITLEA